MKQRGQECKEGRLLLHLLRGGEKEYTEKEGKGGRERRKGGGEGRKEQRKERRTASEAQKAGK